MSADHPKFGWFLSSEEYRPAELVEQAGLAADAGFDALRLYALPETPPPLYLSAFVTRPSSLPAGSAAA